MKKTVQSSKILLLHPMRYALCAVFFLLFTCAVFAGEPPTIITSDTLEHDRETSIYTAKGSVKVVQGGTTIEALEMKYDEKTSNVFPEGDVRYDDQKISVKAERAEYNLDTRTGTFYKAEIFSEA